MTECKVSHCSNEIQRLISLCEDVLRAAVVHICNLSAKDFYERVCKLLGQSVVLEFRAQLVMPFLANKLTVLLLCFQCYIQSLSAVIQAMLLWTATLACLGRNTEKPQLLDLRLQRIIFWHALNKKERVPKHAGVSTRRKTQKLWLYTTGTFI